jgi:hypothetical protein
MPTTHTCPDEPELMWQRTSCLYSLSKNVEGVLDLLESERDECRDRRCVTLRTRHVIKLGVKGNQPCDSPEAVQLDGSLYAVNLVHHFRDGSGNERGTHTADFRWTGAGAIAVGRMSGITNAGTHRRPVFDDCQPCDARGFMEGSFCGTIVRAADPAFRGCGVVGTYRLRFDPSEKGGEGAVQGTVEGVITCACAGRSCVDLAALSVGQGPNPRTESGLVFTVSDHTGTPMPNTEIRTDAGFTGLNMGFSTRVQLPTPASGVDVTLVHFAQPARVEAYDAAGVLVATATMSGPQRSVETLTVSGPQITQAVIHAPQNETLMLKICHTDSR